MAGNLTEQLEGLKRTIERGRTERARAEATLEGLRNQEAELKQELAERGVEPENLEAEIERLRAEVDGNLKKGLELVREGG